MSEEHDCMYGVGEEYGGGLRWYDRKSVGSLNPNKDTSFNYCPICGESLYKTEPSERAQGYGEGYKDGYHKGRIDGRDEHINRYHDMGR